MLSEWDYGPRFLGFGDARLGEYDIPKFTTSNTLPCPSSLIVAYITPSSLALTPTTALSDVL